MKGFLPALATLLALSTPLATDAATAFSGMAAASPSAPFEQNQGQFPSDVAFRTRLPDLGAAILNDGSIEVFGKGKDNDSNMLIRLVNASAARMTARGQAAYRINYIRASRETSVSDVSSFERVVFTEAYPGIDVEYHATDARLEYDFVVAPGADPGQIRLTVQGASLSVDESGHLQMSNGQVTFRQRKPVAYQWDGSKKVMVPCSYELEGRSVVTFALGTYDKTLPLIIDPVVEYASYLGGAASDEPRAVRIGGDGYLYVVGKTTSSNFPRVNAFDSSLGGIADVFVSKVNPITGKLVYSTYIGGTNEDEATALAVDATGAVYIVGNAGSRYPTTSGAYQTGTSAAGFVTKLAPAGNALVYSTLLLGTNPLGVDVDSAGQAVVTGAAGTAFVRTANALQFIYGGAGSAFDPTREGDAFVVKLNAAGTAAVFATYVGGTQKDVGNAIAIDSTGRIAIAGTSESADLPMVRAYQSTGPGGFAVALAADGSSIVYSTYFGTTIRALAADPFGNIVVAGTSNTATLPMVNPVLDPGSLIPVGLGGMSKPFVAKFRLNANLQLAFSTFVGSQLDCCERPYGVAVDGTGDIYVTFDIGISELGYLSTVNSFLSKSYVIAKNAGFNSDVIVVAGYPRDGGRLLYQSILTSCGEARSCRRAPIHARGAGLTLIAGFTAANWFPVAANNHQAAISGTSDETFVMTANSENPPLALESSTSNPSANTAFDLVARSFAPGASGQVTFYDDGTVLGTVTMTEGVARLSVALPAGVGRLTASLGATTSLPLLLPVLMEVCP